MTRLLVLSFIVLILLFPGCRRKGTEVSFYYWKTTFRIGKAEHEVLSRNGARHLYLRYFDVGMEEGIAAPVAVLQVDSIPGVYEVTPVIFIRNEVFKIPQDSLPERVLRLVTRISKSAGVEPRSIQFDCDWNESTRERYFRFLRHFDTLFPGEISATIRLHQVKYKERTGVPPVSRGVLMYYNMGTIGAGNSSVYDAKTAARYNSFIPYYPLPLDLALPVFNWSIQLREGEVVELLNKMGPQHFSADSNFESAGKDRWRAQRSIFKGGYYLRENDEVRCEYVDEASLKRMARELRGRFRNPPRELIFFDLDSSNLAHYDETIYQELAGNWP